MDWTQVRIPTAVLAKISNIIKTKPELGYTNEHEFIRDALRDKIITITNRINPKEAT